MGQGKDGTVRCIDDVAAEAAWVERAAALLRAGGLVVLPTETVYGLAALASDRAALDRIYEIKGRPRQKALALHLRSVDEVYRYAVDLGAGARRVAEAFLPGPLMLVTRPAAVVPPWICSEDGLVGIRVPDHPVAQAVLARVGAPVVATSANRSGRPAAARVEDVLADLAGQVDLVVHTSRPLAGLESTVLDVAAHPPRLLRPGYVTREAIVAVLGEPLGAPGDVEARPHGRVILLEGAPPAVRAALLEMAAGPGRVALLVTDETRAALGERSDVVAMGPRADPSAIASRVLGALRDLERGDADRILVEGIEPDGLGAAVMHRLRRYAARIVTL